MADRVQMATPESKVAPGVLVMIALLLLASTALLLFQNGHLQQRLDENTAAVENLSGQVESLALENSDLRVQNEHLKDTLEGYQQKVRLYQGELDELRRLANLTDYNSTILTGEKKVTLVVPAVMAETYTDWRGIRRFSGYVGIATNLTLEAIPGRGRVLVNTRPPMGEIFQDTAVTAKETAERGTGVSMPDYDLIFSIEAPDVVPSVDGPSAGAAMTLMILSLLEEKSIDRTVSLTGTISSDGKIGPIGGVLEKAKAAEAAGAKIFCIPKGNEYTQVQTGKQYRIGPFIVTMPSYEDVETRVMIEEKTDLTVYVVANIEELARIAIYKER